MDEATRTALATARAFQRASGALRVVLILDDEPEAPTMIEVDEFLDAEITQGEQVTEVPHDPEATDAPHPLPDVSALPPSALAVDLETGQLTAPPGAIEQLANAVLALAAAFGGRTVASVEFASSDPELPVTLAARVGEPVVLAVGEEQLEL
jgi:hypothetical protein